MTIHLFNPPIDIDVGLLRNVCSELGYEFKEQIMTRYVFNPPLGAITYVDVELIDNGFELYDQNRKRLSDRPFDFRPTREQVVELVMTGRIKGKV